MPSYYLRPVSFFVCVYLCVYLRTCISAYVYIKYSELLNRFYLDLKFHSFCEICKIILTFVKT